MNFKEPGTQPQAKPFSQEDARRTFLTGAGRKFLNDLDHPIQDGIIEVFLSQDVDRFRQLANTYDGPTLEAISFALDDALQGVMGEKGSNHSWAVGVLEGQGEQAQRE